MKTLEELQEIIDNSVCPENFPSDLRIGHCSMSNPDSQELFEFSPSDDCDVFSNIRTFVDNAYVSVHTHGVGVEIKNSSIQIHNSQIIIFDCWHWDENVEYKRSETRASRVILGTMLAGPLGAAAGLASSFGKARKHMNRDVLVIAYWDINTRKPQLINLVARKGTEQGKIQRLVSHWESQVKINYETGRQASNSNTGAGSSGCMIFLATLLLPTLFCLFHLCKLVLN